MPQTFGSCRLRCLGSICLAVLLLLNRRRLGTRLRIARFRAALYPEEVLDLLACATTDFLVVAQREA